MIEYTVNKGDTLLKIGEYYGVSIDEIKRINNLTDSSLNEGMILKIPYETPLEYYTIKEGDDLYTLSLKYSIPIETLAYINGLSVGEYVYTNQNILVPKEGYKIYISKKGDTIVGIANTLGASADDIIENSKALYLLPEQLIIYKETTRFHV